MRYSTVKQGIQGLVLFLKRPYNEIKASPPVERFTFWHERVCLPLRLGDKVFKYGCPHAGDKGFVYEFMDECQSCPYLVLLSGEEGKLSLTGDKRFISVGAYHHKKRGSF